MRACISVAAGRVGKCCGFWFCGKEKTVRVLKPGFDPEEREGGWVRSVVGGK